MTSENLYELATEQKCAKYIDFVIKDLEQFDIPDVEYSGDLRTYMIYQGQLRSMYNNAKAYVIPKLNFDVRSAIRDHFQAEVLCYAQERDSVLREIDTLRAQDKETYDARCNSIRAEAEATISPVKQKHNQLLEYKDKLRGVMEHYGITPNDTVISPDITREEFEALLDTSLDICAQTESKLSGLVSKVLSPVHDDDSNVVIGYSVVGAIASWLLLPFIGVAYVGAMVKNTKTMYSNLDKLRIAESLMHSVDFTRFIPDDERYSVPDYDNTEVEQLVAEKLEVLQAADPELRIQEEFKKFNTDAGITYVSNAVQSVMQKAKDMHAALLEDLERRLEVVDQKVKEEQEHVRRLGDSMNKSAVMDTRYIVGTDTTGLPIYKDFGLTNINFVGKYSKEAINFIKVMWVNAWHSVRANCLETCIYDEEYLGQDFAEFITPKTQPYIKVCNAELQRIQTEMRQRAASALMNTKNDTILEYNKNAESQGMITQPYYLYLFLSGLNDKYLENKPIMELSGYSAKAGVMIWTIYPQEVPGCLNIKLPMSLPQGKQLVYDFDLGSRALHTFEYDLENNKSPALDYRKGYLLKYLPEDQWWKKDSIKGVNIRLGLEGGDPSKPYCLRFDDKNVHFLLGGATGAGKSVAIDCTMQSMLHEYATDELQLIYIDMKNVEVSKYTKDGVSLIPHALIIAGTTDGEYCLSVFDWAMDEMLRRVAINGRYKTQKVEDLRKKFDDPSRPDYNPEVHIPRIVILIDEFQVMFDTSRIPAKIIDKITGRITSLVKLARAASIHLWFTSQEMTGTLSRNVLDNFSTRGALRCSRDTSTQLIGNEASGGIKEKVGWMYSNTSAGQDPNANQLWRVPYAPGDDLLLGMKELREKAIREGKPCLQAPFFDEKQGRSSDYLRIAYEEEPQLKKPVFFALGERTVYSTRRTPLNFAFAEDDKENLFCTAFERRDCLDLISTFMDNIQLKGGGASYLINCCDKDTAYLLNLESKVDDMDKDFLSPTYDVEDMFLDFDDILDYRSSVDLATVDDLYVMLLMWEKKDGIGQGEDFKLVSKLKDYIAKLNAVKVHFIFISRELGGLRDFANLCKHKICAKSDERTCMNLIDDTTPFKYPSPNQDEACFALYKYGSDMRKFKIYRYKLERELEAREL